MRLTTSSLLYISYGAYSLLLASGAESSAVAAEVNGTYVDPQDGLQNPIVMRKMSDDEGEKFFFDYWVYDTFDQVSRNANASKALIDPRPALLLHTDTNTDVDADSLLSATNHIRAARHALSVLLKRDFQCPAGTFSCNSIGQAGSCCSNGDTCVAVQDTGLGVVGCCPEGETCGGTVGSCGAGYSSCSSNLGGGCCIPGYQCVTGGCAFVSTYTVTEQSTTIVSSSTVSSTPPLPPPVSTTSSSASTSTSSTTSTSSSSDSTVTSTTMSPIPPVRPTTDSQTTITSSTSSSTSTSIPSGVSTCPTGFYACSAVYEGGCCRVGRNCDTSSCPAISSTAVINTDGVTVDVPPGSAATAATESGSCATGWFSCAASAGGGCCPSGYACGSSCTASNSGTATATVVKEQPGVGGKNTADLYICGAAVLIALYVQFIL